MDESSIYIGEGGLGESQQQYYFAQEVEEVFDILRTSDHGLSSQEVFLRQQQHGRNMLDAAEKESHFMKFLGQFKEPLILLLLSSAFISLLLGELADAIGIFLAVVIVNVVGFIQEYRSEKSVEALKCLVAHKARVLRDGKAKEVDAEDLVPGDIVLLEVGDRVPADLRLYEVCYSQPFSSPKFSATWFDYGTSQAKALMQERVHISTCNYITLTSGIIIATPTGHQSSNR